MWEELLLYVVVAITMMIMSSLSQAGPTGFYAIQEWDEWDDFRLISSASESIRGEQLVQGLYTEDRVRFEPGTLQLKGKNPTTIPPCSYYTL